METFIHLLIYSFAVYLVSKFTKLIYIKDFLTAILFSAVLGIVNALVKPIFVIIFFPIEIITFGIFLIFINGLMLIISSAFFKEIKINGCFSAAIASVLISIIVSLLEYFI
ncbi:MAG: phage holin family protein [Candidatus Cloacimonetes bacterium]|nr:phage holin family protein [Candidatus Cloacimonadota bacterium]